MTFRDDHDAALARVDALERDVESNRVDAERAAAKLALVEAERDRLQAEVTRLGGSTPPPSTPQDKHAGTGAVVLAFIVLAVCGIPLYWLMRARTHETAASPLSYPCTLRTDPAGAEVYAVWHDRSVGDLDTYIGRTPLTMSAFEWNLNRRFEARHEGFRPVVVEPCSRTTYRLEPQ